MHEQVNLLGIERLGATGSGWRSDKHARRSYPGLPSDHVLLRTDVGGRQRVLVRVFSVEEAERILEESTTPRAVVT